MRHWLLAALLLGACFKSGAQPASLVPTGRPLPAGKLPVPLAKGQSAPDFRLMDASGQAVALRDLRGKVVYLDFWYSGCRPCLAEAPAAARLKQQFAGQDVVFAYISIETNVDDWRQAIEKNSLAGLTSIHLIDPEGKYAARAYRVYGFPTYLLLDRQGRVWDGNAPRPSEDARAAVAIRQALATR